MEGTILAEPGIPPDLLLKIHHRQARIRRNAVLGLLPDEVRSWRARARHYDLTQTTCHRLFAGSPASLESVIKVLAVHPDRSFDDLFELVG